jgi:hypothetical protein
MEAVSNLRIFVPYIVQSTVSEIYKNVIASQSLFAFLEQF